MRGDSNNWLNTDFGGGYPHFGTNADTYTWSTSNGSNADGFTSTRLQSDTWHRYTGTFIVPTGTTNLYLSIPFWLGKTPNDYYTDFTGIYIDDVIVSTGAVPEYTPLAMDYSDNILIPGKVGIGTGSPINMLQVEQGTILANAVQSDTVFDGVASGVTTCNIIGSDGYWAIRTATNNSINFDVFNGGSELAAMTVLQSGDVGIGTTAPSHKLHVVSASSSGIKIESTNNPELAFYDTHSNVGSRNWGISTNELVFGDFSIAQSNAKGGNPQSAGTKRFYIDESGNVGIGTTGPTGRLTVSSQRAAVFAGSGTNAGSYYQDPTYPVVLITTDGSNANSSAAYLDNSIFTIGRGGNISGPTEELLRVNLNGAVGIGTDAPSEKLHLVDGDMMVDSGRGIRGPAGTEMIRFNTSTGTLINAGGAVALTLDTSQNATFAGNVQAGSAKSFGDPKHKSLTKTQSGTVAGTDTLMTTFTITVPYSSFWAPGYIVVRGSGSIANIAGRTSIYKRYRYVNYGGSGYALDEDESDIVGDMDVTTSSPNAQTLTFNVRYNDTNYDGTARTMIANVTVAGYYGVTIT
jgi:hypothetical protein